MIKKLGFLLLLAVATSCTYQENNQIEQDDLNEGNERVYGVHPDSSARQLKNKYESKPELGAKANEIKNKWFN